MATIGEAIKYPWSGGGRYFYFFVWLIPIVGFIAYAGYLLRVIQSLLKGEEKVPSWGSWGENLLNGLKVILVGFVWGMVMQIGTMILGVIPVIGVLLTVVFAVLAGLVIVVLMMQMAKDYDLGAGFKVDTAVRFVLSNVGGLLVALLKGFVVSIVYMIVPMIVFMIGAGSVAFQIVKSIASGVAINYLAILGSVGTGIGLIVLAIVLTMLVQHATKLGGYKLYVDVYKGKK